MNKIGFSTGVIYTWADSINEQINILKKFNSNAIELNYAVFSTLYEEISKENIDYLKSLEYVSIHAPFFDKNKNHFIYENNSEVQKVLNRLSELSKLLNAKAVVFHPNLIKDYSLLKNVDFVVGIENLTAKRNISIVYLEDLFKKYPNFKLILDTAHALDCGEDNLKELIDKFKSKILHVHFSDYRFNQMHNKLKEHQTLAHCEDFSKFNKLKELNCPMIIEISLKDNVGDFKILENELKTVFDFFND